MRFALIGNGPWSKTIQRLLSEMSIEYVVYTTNWVTDLNQAEEAFDAVMVLTPAPTQVSIAKELIERGVMDIWLEKSAFINTAQVDSLKEARVYVNFPYYFHPAVNFIADNLNQMVYYESIKDSVETGHRDGDPFRNHGVHDIFKLLFLDQDLSNFEVTHRDNKFVVEGDNFKITTRWGMPERVRSLIVKDSQSRFTLRDNTFLYNKTILNVCTTNPLKDSLKEFVVSIATGKQSEWNKVYAYKVAQVLERIYRAD